jgi:hypothetical protein
MITMTKLASDNNTSHFADWSKILSERLTGNGRIIALFNWKDKIGVPPFN